MRSFFLVLSAILLSILFVGLFAPSSANAQSAYDDIYQTTNQLRLVGDHYGVDEDVSTRWTSLITSDEGLGDGITPRFRSTTSNPATQQQISSMRASFNNAIFNGGRWTVSNGCWTDPGGEFCNIMVSWSEDDSLTLNWATDRVYASSYDYTLTITQNIGTQGDKRYQVYIRTSDSTQQSNAVSGYLATYPPDGVKSFIAYANPNYPPGYSGIPLQETYTPPIQTNFEYNYSVDDKQITLNDVSNLSIEQTDCYFQITPNGTQVYSELYFDCELKQSVVHTVDEYGLYDIVLVYVTPDGIKSSISTTINVDGSNFTGFHADGGSGNKGQLGLDAFNNFLGSDNGVVSAAVLAPLEAIKKINSTDCLPLVIPFLSSSNITIPCTEPVLGSNMNNLKTSVQLIILGIVMYLISIGVLAKIKSLSSPEDDRIEVVKL